MVASLALAGAEVDPVDATGGRRATTMLVYVLAEHQSKVDPWMAFRLLS
jgi:hypothetical protein